MTMPSFHRRSNRPSRERGPADPAAQGEEYRILRSNLTVTLADIAHPTVLVTSAYAGEGKSSITAQLGVSFASAGQRVALIDLDLRKPTLHTWFAAHSEFGVSDVLLGRRPLKESLQTLEVGSRLGGSPAELQFLAAGPTIQQTTELLSTRATGDLLAAIVDGRRHLHEAGREEVDLVLIDAPPVLPIADALVVGRLVSGALLVVEAGKTPIGALQQAKDALTRNQTRLFGVVMNARSPGLGPEYGYGYGYG